MSYRRACGNSFEMKMLKVRCFLWTEECGCILLILRKLLVLLFERLCDRNQEQKGKLPVGNLAVLRIVIPNSCPYIVTGELKVSYVFIIKNLDNIREAKIKEYKIFILKSRNTHVHGETYIQENF